MTISVAIAEQPSSSTWPLKRWENVSCADLRDLLFLILFETGVLCLDEGYSSFCTIIYYLYLVDLLLMFKDRLFPSPTLLAALPEMMLLSLGHS